MQLKSFRLFNLLERPRKFADRGWYAPFVGLLGGLDQFIVIVPIEALIIPGVLVRPSRWLTTALWVATGCALGAMALASVADRYGLTVIQQWAPHVVDSPSWARSMGFIHDYGAWALLLVAAGPFPQQPAVALAGLSHMPPLKVLGTVWAGRTLKYCFLAYLASHAPKVLAKIFPRYNVIQEGNPDL